MLELIVFGIFIVVLIIAVLVKYIRYVKQSISESPSYRYNKENSYDYVKKLHISNDATSTELKDEFKIIQNKIKRGFNPTSESEETCENELVDFLNKKLPGRIISKGQSVNGRRIDFVFEGTYALELVVVNNEGKLISVMDQMMKSKDTYSKVLLILVDIGAIPTSKINDYASQYESIGIPTIVKSIL